MKITHVNKMGHMRKVEQWYQTKTDHIGLEKGERELGLTESSFRGPGTRRFRSGVNSMSQRFDHSVGHRDELKFEGAADQGWNVGPKP